MPRIIEDYWVASTTRIEVYRKSGNTSLGTGFFVYRHINKDLIEIYLITNKHIIHKEKKEREKIEKITLHVNMDSKTTMVSADEITVELPPDKSKIWREHPDDDVDVIIIKITDYLKKVLPILKHHIIPFDDYIADSDRIKKYEITMGDDLLIVGYPDIYPYVVSHGNTNYPFVRQGILASKYGYSIIDVDKIGSKATKVKKRTLRGFLIDGNIISGSSGSPVILKPISGRTIGQGIQLEPPPPLLLGVAAENREIRKKDGSPRQTANMGFAFDAGTIIETMDLFNV